MTTISTDTTGEVWAISMVRDEADIIRATVGNMLYQVDRVLVADNLSSDNTPYILKQMVSFSGGRLQVVKDKEPGYFQSDKMTALAQRAYHEGASWIVPFDADEFWVGSIGTVAATLRAHEADFAIVTAELFDHVATAKDPQSGDIIDRLPWRRRYPLDLPKVAVRAHPDVVIHQGNHNATLPIPGARTPTPRLTVHHYPYRSLEQFVRKVRNGADAYAAAGDAIRPEVGAHWRQWGEMTDAELEVVFKEWYWRDAPEAPIWHGVSEYPPLIRDVPRR